MNHEEISAELHCSHCGLETLHTLIYAGRLLVSTTCQNCQRQVKHDPGDLRVAYIKDLEHRISTKPGRLWKRFWSAPLSIMWNFPRKSMQQPGKIFGEIKKLFK